MSNNITLFTGDSSAIVPLAGAVFHLWVMLHGHGKPRSDRDSA